MLELIPPGLIQGITLCTITALTFVHCYRKAHR